MPKNNSRPIKNLRIREMGKMKRKNYEETTYEYPLEKARKILEEDGTTLSEAELKKVVAALTLLAKKEAELLNLKHEKYDY